MYKLSINGSSPADIKEYYEKGELVKVRFPFMTDTTMDVTAEGVNGTYENKDGWIYYCFEMPDHDVDVTVSYESNMQNKNQFSPLMFHDMSMFGLQSQEDNSTPKKPSFCPECGNPIDENWKFCRACGNSLEPQKK